MSVSSASGRLDPLNRSDPRYWLGDRDRRFTDWAYYVQGASFDDDATDVWVEALDLMLGRHKDYGPKNIANAYPDPLTALVVRMTDKLERIKNILSTGGEATYGERARDSWLDLANYALIGVMCMDGTWPGISARNSSTPLNKENPDVPLGDHPRPASAAT